MPEDVERGHPLGVAGDSSSHLAAPILELWTTWAEKTNIRDGLGLPLCEGDISSPSLLKHKGKIPEEAGGRRAAGGWRLGPASS